MNNEAATPDAQRSNQWKQVFESALNELGAAVDSSSARTRPIVPRRHIAKIPVDPYTAQKRALTDAATALAALWKKPAKDKNTDDRPRSRVPLPAHQPAHSF